MLTNILKKLDLFSKKYRKLIEQPADKHTYQRYLEKITSYMPGNFYWKNKNGHYLGGNKALLEAINIDSLNDLIGKTDYDLWPEQADELRKNDIEVMETGEPLYTEEIINLPKIGKRYFTALKMPFFDENDKLIGIIGNSLDITELKEIQQALLEAKEKAEAANQMKDMFMENMSHDFKTPLNGIYGVVQILAARKQEFPEDIQDLIDTQEKSVKRLTNMVLSILEFSKVNSGQLEIAREELNLLDIIESIVLSLTFKIKNRPVDIIIDYPSDVPRHLIGDSRCTNSVILNLMSNAVKFTNEGHVSISVRIIEKEENHVVLQIKVSDTGDGIPKNKYKEIFERFHRLELSNKGLKEGHGIGLSVVHELVEKLNGKIDVDSKVGKGSTFTLELPFEVLNDMTFFASEWEKQHPDVKILVINDKTNSIAQLDFKEAIIDKTTSRSFMKKLESAIKNKHSYQIIIVDDDLKVDSLSLIHTLHKDKRFSTAMKLLSLQPQQERDKKWFDKARKSGCFDFIQKPILPSELDKKIVETWKKWEARPLKNGKK